MWSLKTKLKHMKYIIAIISLSLTVYANIFAQDVQFKAEARNAVLAGEKFQLVYTVNQEGEDLRLPTLENFTVLMGPSTMQSSSTSFINGKVTRSQQFSYTYIVKCDKPGTYTIDPAQITVDGKKYSSNSLSIDVVKNNGQSTSSSSSSTSGRSTNTQSSSDDSFSKDDLFITVTKNKSSVYQGEPLVLTTKIYTRINLDNISDIKHPSFKNFIVQDIDNGSNIKWSYEFVNNKRYQVGTLEQKILYAQHPGVHEVEPTEIEFLIKQRVARRSGSIFDDFFDNNYRVVKKRVKSKPLKITVKPFPGGEPANFSGGVGNLKMDVTSSQNDAKVNDGITIKINISGTGNHKLISTPKLNIPTDFDVFDPTINNNFTNTTQGMKGSKSFEYLIIPRHEGTFTIDPIQFTYFNTTSKKFETLKSDPIKINVAKSDHPNATSTYVPSSVSKEDVKFIGKDIRYIKTEKLKLKEKGTFLFGSLLFYVGYIFPLIILLIIYLIYRKKLHENANQHLMKNKKANKMAHKRLKQASLYMKENNHEAFYEEVLKAIYTYLSDKLYLPVSELTKEKVVELIEINGANSSVKDQLLEILDTCEFARYSPSSGNSEEMDKLYKKALDTIGTLDNQIKKVNQ